MSKRVRASAYCRVNVFANALAKVVLPTPDAPIMFILVSFISKLAG